jgi:CheY-like chemotaxis protein
MEILIVEGQSDTAESLATLLGFSGYGVQVTSDGPSAIVAAEKCPPDVVLLDLGLPGNMDGWEVVRRLRQMSFTRRPQVIAVTGYSQEEDRKRSIFILRNRQTPSCSKKSSSVSVKCSILRCRWLQNAQPRQACHQIRLHRATVAKLFCLSRIWKNARFGLPYRRDNLYSLPCEQEKDISRQFATSSS